MKTESAKQRELNRRRFLVVSGAAAFALIMHRSVARALGAQPEENLGGAAHRPDEAAAGRILIAYATKCGSTATVAEAIKQVLVGTGASVDLRLAKSVKDLSPYRAVIVGSPIYMGKWMSEAAAFVRKNQDLLGRLPTAFFVVCLTMKDDTKENRETTLAYLNPVRKGAPGVRPVAVGLFPGVADFSKLSFLYKTMLKAAGGTEGDYRNIPAVKRWASDLGPALAATPAPG